MPENPKTDPAAQQGRTPDDLFIWSLYFGLMASVYTAFNLWKSDPLPAGEWHFDDEDVLDIAMDQANTMMRRRGEELGGQP
ncbi:MAG: hypothetical protein PHI39_03485 [Kiritimatiellae bacterium]|nr:hypothetical protein [Kiritimatiellia bacterium]